MLNPDRSLRPGCPGRSGRRLLSGLRSWLEPYSVWYHSGGARWNLIPFRTTREGLVGTLFRLVPLGRVSLEPYSVWYHSGGSRWNLIPFRTTREGLVGTLFRFVPLGRGSLEPYSVSYHSGGARWNLIPFRTTRRAPSGTPSRLVPPFRALTRGTNPNSVPAPTPAVVPNQMRFQPPPGRSGRRLLSGFSPVWYDLYD